MRVPDFGRTVRELVTSFSVLLGTPIAIAGAFFALLVRGQELNVYAQIGLVMLIGLAAKNAILIVEFAKMEYAKGELSLIDATLKGKEAVLLFTARASRKKRCIDEARKA